MDKETFARNFFSGLFVSRLNALSMEFIIKNNMNPEDKDLIELHSDFVNELYDLLERYSFDDDNTDQDNWMNKYSPN
ncbi:hypothetical protein OBK03_03410 [Empedobacter falsenii]